VDERRVRRRSKTGVTDEVEIAKAHSRRMEESKADVEEGSLQWQFRQYAQLGRTHADGADELDNSQWVKYLKDTGVIGKKFTTTDADLAFTRHVMHGARRIGFAEFQEALQEAAVKLFPKLDEGAAFSALEDKVLRAGGPKLTGTKADDVRLNKTEIGHVRDRSRSRSRASSRASDDRK